MQVGRYGDVLLFGLLAILALVTAAEELEADAPALAKRWEIHTSLRCTTELCPTQGPVAKTTKTTKVLSYKTVSTRTVRSGKTTVKDPYKTTTVVRTFRSTKTVTHSTITKTVSKWTATRTITDLFIEGSVLYTYLLMSGVYTTTIRPQTTVPTSPGFTAAPDDPYNAKAYTSTRPRRRDLEPRAPGKSYPKKIYCTKTIKTVYSVIGTKTVWSSTVKVAGKTSIKSSQVVTTRHVTPSNPRTVTTTKTQIGTTTSTVRRRSTTVDQTITYYTRSTTVTSYAPLHTGYAACANRNYIPPVPPYRWYVNAVPGTTNQQFLTNGSWVDCCEACHGLPESEGKCLGSYWQDDTPEHRLCQELNELECPELDHTAICFLKVVPSTGTCTSHGGFKRFENLSPERGGVIMNGPACAYWRFQA